MTSDYDVTVAVWNGFWSFQLIEGLVRHGYTVRALGTTRRRPCAQQYRLCWPSALLTQLPFRAPFSSPRLRGKLSVAALRSFEAFAARRLGQPRCFWGWSGHALRAIERAQATGLPVILETGSTHVLWSREQVSAEYRKRAVPFDDRSYDVLQRKMLTEYTAADVVCVPSRFVAGTFARFGVPVEKLYINPFGVDNQFWRACRPDASGRPLTMVYAAQVMLRKGVYYLLEAWRQAALPDSRLLLVGGVHPDARSLLRALPAGVSVRGFLPHDALRRLYAACDVYVLPSLEEGLARSVLEAMAAGLPAIVTEESGATDILVAGEDGYTVPAGNTEALVAVLQRVHRERADLPRMGASARQRVQPCSWAAYGERCVHLLDRLIGPPSSAS